MYIVAYPPHLHKKPYKDKPREWKTQSERNTDGESLRGGLWKNLNLELQFNKLWSVSSTLMIIHVTPFGLSFMHRIALCLFGSFCSFI